MPHFSSRFFFLLAFCTMSACICMAHSEWTEWRMVKTAAILCKFFFSFALFFFEPLDQDYSLYNVFAFYSVGTAFIFLLFFFFCSKCLHRKSLDIKLCEITLLYSENKLYCDRIICVLSVTRTSFFGYCAPVLFMNAHLHYTK